MASSGCRLFYRPPVGSFGSPRPSAWPGCSRPRETNPCGLICFTRAGALDPLAPALDGLPPEARERLSVRRIPAGTSGVWLHPGEPVFDALSRAVRERFARDAARGAIFTDPRASEPYFFHLGLASVEEEPPPRTSGRVPGLFRDGPPDSRLIERRLVGLRQNGDGTLVEEPVERMLLLRGAPGVAPGAIPLASRSVGMRVEAARHARTLAERLAEERRARARREEAARRRRLAARFDLRASQLARRRKDLRARTEPDEEAQADIRRQQASLAADRARALRELAEAPRRIRGGDARLVAHALVAPAADSTETERHDERVEEMAVRIAGEWERGRGARLQDVSKPEKARAAGLADWPGFDLVSTRPGGETRNIEVKDRVGRGSIQIEENEWKQACHLGERYWLYVVFDCGTPHPHLVRVQNPFGRFLASRRVAETRSIAAGRLREAAEPDPVAPSPEIELQRRFRSVVK